VAWVLLLMARFDGSAAAFQRYDLHGQHLQLRSGEEASDYISRRSPGQGRPGFDGLRG